MASSPGPGIGGDGGTGVGDVASTGGAGGKGREHNTAGEGCSTDTNVVPSDGLVERRNDVGDENVTLRSGPGSAAMSSRARRDQQSTADEGEEAVSARSARATGSPTALSPRTSVLCATPHTSAPPTAAITAMIRSDFTTRDRLMPPQERKTYNRASPRHPPPSPSAAPVPPSTAARGNGRCDGSRWPRCA
jgi:hypothetical protein